jgi:hypothetical protein
MPRWFTRDGVVRNLNDALRERVMLWIFCRYCGHATRMDPRPVAHRTASILFETVATIFVCQRCGTKNAVILPSMHKVPPRG